jgi:hypothetical protein
MRDLNFGAKNHLRPIMLAMKPQGLNAAKAISAVLGAYRVPVPQRLVPKQGERRRVLEQ